MNEADNLMEMAYKRIEEMRPLVEQDYHRLHYHIMPPTGLLNDPNGFINFSEEYHLFYQFHPFDTKHGLKYWGHVKSSDLVSWEPLPIALSPSNWYETHGCYSGSAVNNNGIFTLIYTGNVKDDKGNRETYQCLAETNDSIVFKKSNSNPVIHNQPKGYTRHFRDPKVWNHKGLWYMVIGTQTEERKGRVLLLKSNDLVDWAMVGEVTGSNINGLGDLGYMWECPDLFQINKKDVLIACPQGVEPQGDLYNNVYQAGYFVGKLDYETGQMDHGKFVELDRGFEFYAPQTTLDSQGRRLMFGWMGLPDKEDHPTKEYGWIHCMTIPRELKLKGNKLCQSPVRELEALRKNEITYENINIENESIELERISGDVFEMIVDIESENAEIFGLRLRCSKDKREETLVYYDKNQGKLVLDRSSSGKGYGGVRRCSIKDYGILRLHIFSDTSSLEIFVNDGEEVFTCRIYPSKESQGIEFFAKNGDVVLKKLKKWNIK